MSGHHEKRVRRELVPLEPGDYSGRCGHNAGSANGTFVCDRSRGHAGWHGQDVTLRDGRIETTNWGSDGLAPHASRDRFNG